MDVLNNYRSFEENTETLFSILIYNKSKNIIIKNLDSQLEKAKDISNIIKKKKINNRLFNLINYINDNFNEDSIINSIFLLNDKIFEYKLNNTDVQTAEKYKFLNFYIKNDIKFHVEYFIDIFTNFNFIYTMNISKSDLIICEMNKNKEKTIENNKINNEIMIIESIEKIRKNYNYKDVIIIYGNSQFLSKLNNIKNLIIIKKDSLNKTELYDLYEKEIFNKNNLLLEEKLNDLKNEKTNTDLYVFGKLKFEIKESIELYIIKELYIEDKKLEKLKTFVDESYFNFKIIIIKSLEQGDIADNFIKDYNGVMGIKYY